MSSACQVLVNWQKWSCSFHFVQGGFIYVSQSYKNDTERTTKTTMGAKPSYLSDIIFGLETNAGKGWTVKQKCGWQRWKKTTYMLDASWKITLWPRVSNATVSVANVENAHHSTRWVLEKLIIQHSTSFHRVVWRLSLKLWDLEILTKDL